jgi:hypothetical protein
MVFVAAPLEPRWQRQGCLLWCGWQWGCQGLTGEGVGKLALDQALYLLDVQSGGLWQTLPGSQGVYRICYTARRILMATIGQGV